MNEVGVRCCGGGFSVAVSLEGDCSARDRLSMPTSMGGCGSWGDEFSTAASIEDCESDMVVLVVCVVFDFAG